MGITLAPSFLNVVVAFASNLLPSESSEPEDNNPTLLFLSDNLFRLFEN